MKAIHPCDRLLSRYRYWRRKLRELEREFDGFCRANRDNEAARIARAESDNRQYFAIKARLQDIKASYWIERSTVNPLCSVNGRH